MNVKLFSFCLLFARR